MPIFKTNSGSIGTLQVSGSTVISSSISNLVQIIGSGNGVLTVSGSTGAIFEVSDSNASSTKLFVFSSASVDVLSIYKNNTVEISSGSLVVTGSVLISGSAGVELTAIGTVSVISGSLAVGNISPSATVGRIDASNDVVAFSTSDERLKINIAPIHGSMGKVNSISGVEFDWISNPEIHGNSGHDVGVIAQEIEKVLPEVVTTRDNGYKAVKYEKIVPLLIEAIKDLQRQIDELKTKI